MNSEILFYCLKEEFYEFKLIVQIRLKINGRKRPLETLLYFYIKFRNFFYRIIRKANKIDKYLREL